LPGDLISKPERFGGEGGYHTPQEVSPVVLTCATALQPSARPMMSVFSMMIGNLTQISVERFTKRGARAVARGSRPVLWPVWLFAGLIQLLHCEI
jgi:hypothetical protein